MTEAKSPGTPRKRATGKRAPGRDFLTVVDSGDDQAPEGGQAPARGPNQAQQLIALAHELYDLGISTEGRAFVVAKGGPNAARWLRGGTPSVIGALAATLHKRTRAVATGNAKNDALALLTAQAESCDRTPLVQRVGQHGDNIVLDLADAAGHAVVITKKGWSVVDRSPIPFTRSLQTLPLPIPVRGGSVDELWPLVNIAPSSRNLYVAYVVSNLFRSLDHPILDLSGEAGTGKSTTARNTARLIDPSAAPLARMPTHEKDLDIVASQSYVQGFDNISRIEDWQSDALCTFCTGISSVRRALFTDSEMALLSVRLCVILTSIDYGTPKADLAQRLLPVKLTPLGTNKRRGETQIDMTFTANHPRILGALLDLAVKVLAELPGVESDEKEGTLNLPRLAEFGKILVALDRATGTSRLDEYHELMSEQASDVAAEDEVATAVRVFTREHEQWDGTATELHGMLRQADFRSRFWPETVAQFSKRLSLVVGPLRAVGVRVEHKRTKDKRVIHLSVIGSSGDAAASTSGDQTDAPQDAPSLLAGPCDRCLRPGEFCGRGQVADRTGTVRVLRSADLDPVGLRSRPHRALPGTRQRAGRGTPRHAPTLARDATDGRSRASYPSRPRTARRGQASHPQGQGGAGRHPAGSDRRGHCRTGPGAGAETPRRTGARAVRAASPRPGNRRDARAVLAPGTAGDARRRARRDRLPVDPTLRRSRVGAGQVGRVGQLGVQRAGCSRRARPHRGVRVCRAAGVLPDPGAPVERVGLPAEPVGVHRNGSGVGARADRATIDRTGRTGPVVRRDHCGFLHGRRGTVDRLDYARQCVARARNQDLRARR